VSIREAQRINSDVRAKVSVEQNRSSTAPYGYLKNPKDKHKFIIDKEASYIVKKIFNMILLGKSRKEIAEHLNNKNVLTPSLYKLSKENTNNEELIRSKKWNAEIVNRILRNETYIGILIQNIKRKTKL
jgi:DNA invertase Pin-like site-specific DNA recombinase